MEVLTQLHHLLPDFASLETGSPAGLVVIIWLILAFILLISTLQVGRHYIHFRKRFRTLTDLIKDLDKDSLAQKRRDTLQVAIKKDPKVVGPLWREFDETLVYSSDKSRLFNTLDADHFFNTKTLAHGLTNSRLLAAAPSFLVAIGVLGTFIGLTVGLDSLNLDSRSNVDTLRDGIDGLIQGAAMAFMTSVWGIFFSVVLNFTEKMFERSAIGKISELQRRVDYLYPRIPAEQSLVHISDNTLESKEALQELHERIGERLQETVEGMSEAMQTALSDTLNKIMGPAIDSLVKNASQQSTEVLESLVTSFMDGMSSAGKDQSQLMQQATQEMNAAMDGMSNQFSRLVERMDEQQKGQDALAEKHSQALEEQLTRLSQASETQQAAMEQQFSGLIEKMASHNSQQFEQAEHREEQRREAFQAQVGELADQQQSLLDAVANSVSRANEQSIQMAQQHQELMKGLERVTESVATSTRHLDSSANQLGVLASHVQKASEALASILPEVANQLGEAGKQNASLASQLKEQSESLEGLQAAIRDSIEQYGEAAKLTHEGITQMKGHQEDWLNATRTEFEALGQTLKSQVEGIEKQASEWLAQYSRTVEQQVEDRMNVWNKHSQEYAAAMLRAVHNMSNVLDELESR